LHIPFTYIAMSHSKF